ncbi:hypothetical protein BDV98DRAFT_115457 [Pterulicium gracile]|uniref:Uncharacterized protein n=1 Tax=Pterulicium gracile TaxID=1884261 RepID=A0A5C3QJK7_9AGAR|nr:hypothetical protein BDV98DRAFT_115457 [Pterula gracilis]
MSLGALWSCINFEGGAVTSAVIIERQLLRSRMSPLYIFINPLFSRRTCIDILEPRLSRCAYFHLPFALGIRHLVRFPLEFPCLRDVELVLEREPSHRTLDRTEISHGLAVVDRFCHLQLVVIDYHHLRIKEHGTISAAGQVATEEGDTVRGRRRKTNYARGGNTVHLLSNPLPYCAHASRA